MAWHLKPEGEGIDWYELSYKDRRFKGLLMKRNGVCVWFHMKDAPPEDYNKPRRAR